MSEKVGEVSEERLTLGLRYVNVNDVLRIAYPGSPPDTPPLATLPPLLIREGLDDRIH